MKKKFNIYIIISLILGIIMGGFFPNISSKLSFIGTIYINLLKFMIIPIIFTSISSVIYNSFKEKSKIILKTILLFTIMFVLSFLITSIIVVLIKPYKSFNITNYTAVENTTSFDISQIITNLFPSNIITMLEENNIFQVIVFSFMFGLCSTKVPEGKKIIDIIDNLKDIFNKLLEYIMYLTPLATLFLVANLVASYGTDIIKASIGYILTAYFASFVVMMLVMIIPLIFIKVNIFTYIKKISKVWLLTMTTCSSSATLPYTIKVCNEELNIPSNITNIVVPLGCTIHMCGGAVSFALLGLFSASLFNIDINISKYILMLISATLINMAAPGIPNGGVVIGTTYLSLLNIPLTFIGTYTGIYRLLDMAYTTLNVTGDISSNVIINYIENHNKEEKT